MPLINTTEETTNISDHITREPTCNTATLKYHATDSRHDTHPVIIYRHTVDLS